MGSEKRRLIAMLAVAAGTAAPLVVAPPVRAEPANDPCALAVSLLCRFMPMAPELEGDVDYTQQQPAAGLLGPESAQPADPCISGCI